MSSLHPSADLASIRVNGVPVSSSNISTNPRTGSTIGKSGRRRRSVQSNRNRSSRSKVHSPTQVQENRRSPSKVSVLGCMDSRRSSSEEILVPVVHTVNQLLISSPPKVFVDPLASQDRCAFRTETEIFRTAHHEHQSTNTKAFVVPIAPINPLVRSPLAPDALALREKMYRATLPLPMLVSSPRDSSPSSSTNSPAVEISISTPLIRKHVGFTPPNKQTRYVAITENRYPSSSMSPLPHHPKRPYSAPISSPGSTVIRDGDLPSHFGRHYISHPSEYRRQASRKSISISEEVHVIGDSSESSNSVDHSPKSKPARTKKKGCCRCAETYSPSSSCSSDNMHLKSTRSKISTNKISVHEISSTSSSIEKAKAPKQRKLKKFRCGGFCGFCKEDPKKMTDYPDSAPRKSRCNGKCCGYADGSDSSVRSSSSEYIVPFVPPPGSAVAMSMNQTGRSRSNTNQSHRRTFSMQSNRSQYSPGQYSRPENSTQLSFLSYQAQAQAQAQAQNNPIQLSPNQVWLRNYYTIASPLSDANRSPSVSASPLH